MRRMLLLVCVLLLPSLAWAEDLYMGPSAVGLGDGSTCANAKDVAFFNNAANWIAGTGFISQGDTVHLCGTITVVLTVQASGAAGVPITILFEPNAKISHPVCPGTTISGALGCLVAVNKSYIIIDGGTNGIVENTANGTAPTYANQSYSVGVNALNCNNCEIKNLTVQNMYVHLFDITDHALDGQGGNPGHLPVNAIRFNGNNTTVHHNTLHDAGAAIYTFFNSSTSGIEIHHNNIYNSDHGWTVAGGSAVTLSNVKFYNNHVHDYSNWDTTANVFHHDGIHAYGTSGSVGDNYEIYNNVFDGACGANMTAHIFMEGNVTVWTVTGTAKIFNNVMLCTNPGQAIVNGIFQMNAGQNEAYNNTIMGPPTLGTCVTFRGGNTNIIAFRNNAISGCNIKLNIDAAVTMADHTKLNNNTYNCSGSFNCFGWIGIQSYTNNLALWRTNCGCDAQSLQVTDLIVGANGAPTSGSPLINAGANLTSVGITALNLDNAGLERFDIGAWTAGAYNPSFPIITNFSVLTEPTLPVMGPKNYKIVDPTFGTTILRVTDATDGAFGRSLYSSYPSVNVNSTRVMGLVSSGFDRPAFWNFNATTFKVSNKQVPTTPPFGYATRWSGTDPDVVYHAGGTTLQRYNVATNTLTTLRDFAANIPASHQVAQVAKDLADNIFGMNINLAGVPKGYLLWRRSDNTILLNTLVANMNETGVDKTGRYFFWQDTSCGDHVYDLVSGSAVFVADATGVNGWCHNGTGVGTVFASQQNAMNIRSLATPNTLTKLMDGFFGQTTESHHQSFNATDESYGLISRMCNQPGDCLVHAAFDNELLQVATSGNAVRRIAHHRSLTGPTQGGDYNDIPFANISPDGRFAAFTSNWGNSLGSNRDDFFLIQIAPPVTVTDTTPPASPTNIRVQ